MERKYRGKSVFSGNRELPWYEQPELSVEQKQEKLRQAERDVKWEKSCVEDTICVNPHHAVGGYAAPTHCVEEYRHICYLSPVLYPVIKKVIIKLPQPVETCINKQVLLPRLECDRVSRVWRI